MGLDAELRHNRAQFQIIKTALYRQRQLCPQVSRKTNGFMSTGEDGPGAGRGVAILE